MKKTKRLITAIILLAIATLTFTLSACGAPKITEKDLGNLSVTFEFMSDAEIPIDKFDGLTEEDVTAGNATFKFVSPEYDVGGEKTADEYESLFPSVYCNRVGTWQVICTYNGIAARGTFQVKDTTAPLLELPELPYDVYKDADKKYSLPRVTPQDLSELDSKSLVETLTLNGESVNILSGRRYVATETGKFEYRLKVSDIYGNTSEISAVWNSKDPDWKDENLEEGYLADYNEEGYINTASSGYMASYWANSALYEEWLSEFEGATGVLKVSAPANDKSLGAFRFKLSKSVTAEDLENKYFVIKLYVPSVIGGVRFGCKTWQSERGRSAECVHNVLMNVTAGEWNTVFIPTSELKYGYFDIEDNEIDEFQIAFGAYQSGEFLAHDAIIYLDAVTLAERLGGIEDISLTDGLLTWKAQQHASAYEVIENEKATVVNTNEYRVENENSIITVRALSNEPTHLSADNGTVFIDMDGWTKYDLAKFDNNVYERVIKAKASAVPAELKAEYDAETFPEENGTLKITMLESEARRNGAFTITLPKSHSGEYTVRFLIESSDASVVTFMADDEHKLELTPSKIIGKWQTVTVNCEESSNQITFYSYSKETPATTVIYFSAITDGGIKGTLASGLKDGELANYNEQGYTETVSSLQDTDALEISFLESYAGDIGVLKLTLTNDGNDAGFVFDLIKSLPDTLKATYTLRLRLEKSYGDNGEEIPLPTAIRMRACDEYKVVSVKDDAEIATQAGVWQTIAVETAGLNKDSVIFYTWCPGATKITLYISCIAEGNKVAELESESYENAINTIKETLQDGFLADFSSEYYELLVRKSDRPARAAATLYAEYIGEYEGEESVIKITTTNNGNKVGDFMIELPKSCEQGMTIKFMVEKSSATYMYWFDPSNKQADKSIDDNALVFVGTGIGDKAGVWQTFYINYSKSSVKDLIEVCLAGGEVGGENVVYISFVIDGKLQ